MVWLGELKELAAFLLPWLVGGGGALALTNWAKGYFNIPDKPWFLGVNARVWLLLVVALVVSVLSHFAEGWLDPGALTPENFAETVISIVTASTTYYFKFLRKEGDK